MKINGKQIAKNILKELKKDIAKRKTKPHLAIIIIGNNPSSISYVKQKQLKAKNIGVKISLIKLDEKISENELINIIEKLNNDQKINGIIVQKPIPKQINNEKINLSINPEKDVDGFSPNSKYNPPIGLAILEVLKNIYKDLSALKNKKIVILGKGETGGKPIRKTLLKLGLSPIIIDSKTKNPKKIIKSSDVVISVVGKKEVIKDNMLKKGVVLIGAGQHLEDQNFYGDYNEKEIKNTASFYTTTPGGIGPINVAMIFKNLLQKKDWQFILLFLQLNRWKNSCKILENQLSISSLSS